MKSDWVKIELAKARKREKTEGRQLLFPLRLCSYEALEDWEMFDSETVTDLAAEVRSYFIPDFSGWERNEGAYGKAFERLLGDLRAEG